MLSTAFDIYFQLTRDMYDKITAFYLEHHKF